MTQQALAEAAGVPQATIARIERGTVVPPTATLIALLAATGHRLTVEPDPAPPKPRRIRWRSARVSARVDLDDKEGVRQALDDGR